MLTSIRVGFSVPPEALAQAPLVGVPFGPILTSVQTKRHDRHPHSA